MLTSCYLELGGWFQHFWNNQKKTTELDERKKETYMNILSLPDEMLANVLKFSKFETVTRLRKRSVRIDNVAIRNDLHKAKVHYIGAEKNVLILKYKTINLMENHSVKVPCSHTISISDPDIHLLFEKQLKKVRDVQRINIESCEIDEKWLKMLATSRKTHMTDIHFLRCNFYVSLVDLKTVLAKFKSVQIEFSAKNTFLYEKITDQVICSLMRHAYIRFEFTNCPVMRNFTLSLTDATLKEVQSLLPSKFSVGAYFTNFTVPEVIETIKSAMSNLDSRKKFWLLGKVRARSREEMTWATNELRSIKGVEVDACPIWIIASSKVPCRGCTVAISYTANE